MSAMSGINLIVFKREFHVAKFALRNMVRPSNFIPPFQGASKCNHPDTQALEPGLIYSAHSGLNIYIVISTEITTTAVFGSINHKRVSCQPYFDALPSASELRAVSHETSKLVTRSFDRNDNTMLTRH